ncbi:MAG: hypothetical protein WKG00_22975 [Polyangiaceae bacterium]
MAASWMDDEPGLARVRHEVWRCMRRARAEWGKTALLTLLVVGLVTFRRWLVPPTYPATVYMSVTEGDLEGGQTAPRTARRLNNYVYHVVFNDQNLLAVMVKHNLSPAMRKRNQPLAIDELREEIDVHVSRNHFIYERQRGEAPRSARLTLTFTSPDPRLSLLVAQDLGDLIISYEAKRRQDQLLGAAQFQAGVSATIEDVIGARARELAAAMTASGPAAALAAARLTTDLRAFRAAQRDTGRAQRDADFLESLEKQQSGLAFELVDWRADEYPRPPELLLAMTALGTLLFALPLLVLAVGAFGRRVYAADDVRRLGIGTLGMVQVFLPGERRSARARR